MGERDSIRKRRLTIMATINLTSRDSLIGNAQYLLTTLDLQPYVVKQESLEPARSLPKADETTATNDFHDVRSAVDVTNCFTENKVHLARFMESNKRKESCENSDSVKDSPSNQILPSEYFTYDDDSQDIKPYFLVEVLADCHEFSSSLSDLLKIANLKTPSVKKLAARYPRIFHLQDENIKLAPNIGVCKAYYGSEGCMKRRLCHNLHICQKFVVENCEDSECVWGHEWDTGHNNSVLRTFFIDLLPCHVLQALLRDKVCYPHFPVVCLNYNKGKCNLRQCTSLHICLNFVFCSALGSTSFCRPSCPLNHNVKSPACLNILENLGISTNETIKDMFNEILSSDSSLWDKNTLYNHPGNDLIQLKKFSSLISYYSQRTSVDHLVRYIKRKKRKRILPNNDSDLTKFPTRFRHSPTVWDHHLEGETPVAEICYKSVENMYDYENFGCLRLHAISHYHWQVRELGGKWLNLRSNQVKCLECAFCDPNKNSVTLPCLDPVILGPSLRHLFVLMGRGSWTSDFSRMILTCPSVLRTLYIRRLNTEDTMGGNISLHHLWYFLDENNEWIQFGKIDSTGDPAFITSLTSDQIEAMYIQNRFDIILFDNSRYSYTLDFPSMMQYNQTTGAFSRVLRRPQPHLPAEGVENLLRCWNITLRGQRMQRVPLATSSPEYKTVFGLLTRNPASSPAVASIEKILNPHLFLAHQNRIEDMTATYGSLLAVDMRYLFSGANPDNCKTICEENFDRRRHGTHDTFGKGIYFETNLHLATRYSVPDTNGNRYLFIASVAVGTKVLGNSSVLDPPINPSTLLPYDSTVDNEQNPTTFVKYNKQDYYPEYLVTFK